MDAKTVAKAVPQQIREHNTTLVAAGVAFYAFLAFIPALIATISIYGLVADPSDVKKQVKSIASALPQEVQDFLNFQLTSIINANRAGVSITLAISIIVALWSASGGMAALISGIHVAHEEDEPKGFVKKKGKALALTLGAIVVLLVVVVLVSALPSLVDNVLGSGVRTLVNVVRWPVVAIVMVLSIGMLYRLSVGYRGRWFGIISIGTLVAAVGWLVLSILFAIYTANFASYAKTYGSLATIVVLLLWLWLSALAVLLGAEVDAALGSAGEAPASR
jgi:membrane protein